MNKYKIAYIDESRDEIAKFQRGVYDIFEVSEFLPRENLDDFIEELIHSDVQAFVADYQLNVYRTDVQEPITYNGADLIERILSIKQLFPCFVLTSYENDAVERMTDVNYVYSKGVLTDEKQIGIFREKIKYQIEHYQTSIDDHNVRFLDLLEKSEERELTEKEENELLSLDSYLENVLNRKAALSPEKKAALALERIQDLISSTTNLLDLLRSQKKK